MPGFLDGVTALSAANLNQCARALDGTAGLKIAACHFTVGATPTLTNIVGVSSVARGGVGDYTITLNYAYGSIPLGVCVPISPTSDMYNAKIIASTQTTVRVLVQHNDSDDETNLASIGILVIGI